MQEQRPVMHHVEPALPPPEPAAAAPQMAPHDVVSAPRQSVLGHLEELRRRLWTCIAAVAVGAIVSFHWVEQVIVWLKRPAGAALPRLAFFGPAEAFIAYLKVSVACGIALAMPVVLAQLWAFLRPAMTEREQEHGALFMWAGSILFVAGVALAYGVLLPAALQFLLGFGHPTLEPIISISQYLGFTTTILLAAGAVFELPLAVYLLSKLGVVTPRALRRQWRVAYVAILAVAALITPTPDAVTMLLLTVPMLALYEASIVVSWLAQPRSLRRD